MNVYEVTPADTTGTPHEVEFVTRWDPEKYGADEVGRAATATVAARRLFVAVSASLREEEVILRYA